MKNPSYEDVCTGRTGHAEAVRIEFDPTIVKFEELVGKQHAMSTAFTTSDNPACRILLSNPRPHDEGSSRK